MFIAGAFLAFVIWGLNEAVSFSSFKISSSDLEFRRKISGLNSLQDSLIRYRKLNVRSEEIERLYARSSATTEQVYTEVDKLVRDSVGGDSYELRPSGGVVPVGDSIEQQVFSLRLKSASLPQLVSLLHKFEQGNVPLLVGKVEMTKAAQPGLFSATVELSSLRRKKNA